jgi:hypothetical protein
MLPIIAAVISTLLANNLPKVAQGILDKGLDAVEQKLGIKLEPDMTPEQIQAVRDASIKHEEFQVEQDNKNTDSARVMQNTALNQADVFSKRFVYYFASFWSLCAALYIGFITFASIPQANIRFADTILGFILGTVIATILNFFFGSSSGSKLKTEIMGKGIQYNETIH